MAFNAHSMEKEVTQPQTFTVKTYDDSRQWQLSAETIKKVKFLSSQQKAVEAKSHLLLPPNVTGESFEAILPYINEQSAQKVAQLNLLAMNQLIDLAAKAEDLMIPMISKPLLKILAERIVSYGPLPLLNTKNTLLDKLTNDLAVSLKDYIVKHHPAILYWLIQDQIVHNPENNTLPPSTMLQNDAKGCAGYALWNTSGTRLFEIAYHDLDKGDIYVWDVQTLTRCFMLQGHTKRVHSIMFNKDNKLIVTASNDDTVKIWSPLDGKCLLTLDKNPGLADSDSDQKGFYNQAFFDPTSTNIITLHIDPCCVSIWNAKNGEYLFSLKNDDANNVCLNHSGSKLLTCHFDQGAVRVWNSTNGYLLFTLPNANSKACQAVFTNSDDRIVTGYDNGSISIWDANTGKALAQLKGHTDEIKSICFNKSDTCMITASKDTSVRVWDLRSNTCILTMLHPKSVNSAHLNKVENCILTVCDNITNIWNKENGHLILTIPNEVAFDSGETLPLTFNDDFSAITTIASGPKGEWLINLWYIINMNTKSLMKNLSLKQVLFLIHAYDCARAKKTPQVTDEQLKQLPERLCKTIGFEKPK